MKGKKLNLDFVNDFIIECANQNRTSPQEVCKEAQGQILALNQEIQHFKQLKHRKNLLLDVLITFDQYKSSKSIDRLMLPFFQITNKNIAYELHQQIAMQPLKLILLKQEIMDILQQMQQLNIVQNQNGWAHPAANFESFRLFLRKYYGRL